jgi:hypothetical protein
MEYGVLKSLQNKKVLKHIKLIILISKFIEHIRQQKSKYNKKYQKKNHYND